jgi:hypothetical protein
MMSIYPYLKIGCVRLVILILTTSALPTASWGDDDLPAETGEPPQVDVASHLVLISYRADGVKKSGYGVIVQMEGKPYLLTNQHLILGAEKLSFNSHDGKKLSPRSVELSNSRDLARLALPEDVGPGLLLSSQAKMNTPISVLMNDDEGLAKKRGSIIGVGATRLEISTAFDASGNGAPVINSEKEVVGVTSYSRESSFSIFKSGSRFQKSTRYFCSRVGKEDWRSVNWKAYNNKYGKVYRTHDIFFDHVMDILDEWDSPHETAAKADKLATECRTHARQLSKMADQQGLTDFLQNDFEDKVAFFENIGDALSEYADYKR